MTAPATRRLAPSRPGADAAAAHAGPATRRPFAARPVALSGAAIALVVVAGALALPMPFWGDQALFTVYARQLSEGAVLYRDLFDVKQPGIFYFFALGGMLFGFTEVGVHLLELVYFVAFSAFAVLALRPYFKTPWGAPAVPVLTVAVYYLQAQVNDLTQIEILVAFPILAAWWLIDRADLSTRRLSHFAAAGVLAAAVVALKYVYVVIILGFLAYAVVRARRRGVPAADLRRALAAFGVALLVPVLVLVAHYAAHGQLGRIWWAYFEYAPGATALVPRDLGFLAGSARRFFVGHAPVLLLATIGCLHVLRGRVRPQRNLAAGMILWLAVGAVAFAVQLWAEYKWLLFTVPLGVLAVFGLEALAEATGRLRVKPRPAAVAALGGLSALGFLVADSAPRMTTLLLVAFPLGAGAWVAAELMAGRPGTRRQLRRLVLAALAVTVGLTAVAPVGKVRTLAEHDFALTAEARDAYQRAVYAPYAAADRDLATLARTDVLPGPMYVLGHPAVLLRANRPQAVPMLGWAYEVHDGTAWQEMHRDLQAAMPPYIVVHDHAEPFVASRSPALLDFIESEYETAFVGASGTWYVRRG